jgi:predicted amidohydrolase YtcJ
MKKFTSAIILIIGLSLFAFGQKAPADLILFNGKVFTSDLAKPAAEAVAIRGERIVAVGTNKEVEKLATLKTRKIDLQGRVVIPGINDAHFHFSPEPHGFRLAFETMEPSWRTTIEALEDAVKRTSKGEWIFGTVGGDVIADVQANRFALDHIAPNNPVLLRTYFGHGYIFNSKAMPLLRIAEEEVDPLGGNFERIGNTKKVNGRIFEYADWRQSRTLAEQVSDEDAIRDLKIMAEKAVGFGITSMQIMPSMSIDRFARLLVRADLPIRVRAISFSLTDAKGRDMSEIRQLSKLKFPNSKVSVNGIKWILDGTPFERGAALRKDYDDKQGWRGKLNFPESEIEKMIRESLGFNQPLLLHCVGDKACEVVFDAMEKIGNGKIDWKQKRVRIEHGDGILDDLLVRAKKLGVVIVQNPTHFALGELGKLRWGGGKSRIRSMIDAGIPFALGSDGPMNPFLNIMFASIHPDNPAEAITREQAVRAYTYGSAFAEFAENEKGTIATGKLADLVVLSQDIFAATASELPKVNSILTIVGGKIVHDAKVLK